MTDRNTFVSRVRITRFTERYRKSFLLRSVNLNLTPPTLISALLRSAFCVLRSAFCDLIRSATFVSFVVGNLENCSGTFSMKCSLAPLAASLRES